MYYSSLAYAELPIPDRLYFVTRSSVPLGFLCSANGAFPYVFLDEMTMQISTGTSCLLLCSPSIAKLYSCIKRVGGGGGGGGSKTLKTGLINFRGRGRGVVFRDSAQFWW